jgi:NAD+ diphosphatase
VRIIEYTQARLRATGSKSHGGITVTRSDRPPHYAGGRLDRASSLRRDPAWIARQLAAPGIRLLPLWRSRSLTVDLGNGRPQLVCCSGTAAAAVLSAAAEICFLGLDAGAPLFAADLSDLSAEAALALVAEGEFVDLRCIGALLPAREAALGAYARGLLHWHLHNRFCGRCGHFSKSRNGGHVRRCGNPGCGHETYPRTDPAVIMLVEQTGSQGRPARCLLGRNSGFAPGVYSTLAGFVDPGENLEEAVAREVFEEVGVRVDRVVYQASQPWPFPSSIMLGFRARALTSEIRLDGDELEDAAWYSADEIRGFGDWGDPDARLRLPRRDSIAWLLVNAWLGEHP